MSSIADSSVTIQTSAKYSTYYPVVVWEVTADSRTIFATKACFRAFRSACASPGVGSDPCDLTDGCWSCSWVMRRVGERTLEECYDRLQPFANAFMALFGRDRLPARSTLSRFLAALDQTAVESLRTLFLKDGLSRPLVMEEQSGGMFDRQGNHFLVFDVDGTREAAHQRALPKTADRPVPQRRLRPLCAPVYTGRKRGEVVRSRTSILQAHTHQFLGTFGNPGNGEYRAELRRAVTSIHSYLQEHHHPEERALLRLDGQYGTGAVMAAPFRTAVCDAWERLSDLKARRSPGSSETAP